MANIKSDATTISSFDYQYDAANRRTVSLENDGSRVTWTYDKSSQLLTDHRTGTSPYRNTFTYDANGNRLLKNESGTRTTYAYDAADQLTVSDAPTGRTTYSFDNDGNQQLVVDPTGGRTTTTWDYENRTSLILLPNATRNTMLYEPDGLRIQLADSTGEKNFVWNDQHYLAELDSSNITVAVYTTEPSPYGKLISQRRGTTSSYYHYQALGSTRQLTDTSETVTDTYLFDAWGRLLASSGTTINFFRYIGRLGYYHDADTNTFYIRARAFDIATGRWTSIDPQGFADGINLYKAYFVPRDVDPSGREVEVCCRPTAAGFGVLGGIGFPHCWLKTDTEACGRGTIPGKSCNSCPYSRNQQVDHSKQAGKCKPADEYYGNPYETYQSGWYIAPGSCDEVCVNNELQPGRPVPGRWCPFGNDCHTFVLDVLKKCCSVDWVHIAPAYTAGSIY